MVRLPPPVYAAVAAITQRLLASDRPRGVVRTPVAAAVGAGSVALMGGAAREFRRRGTTLDPFEPRRTSALVTGGANRVTRNPMYVGLAGLLTAHALYRGGLLPWVPVAAFVAVVDRLQIPPEEAALREIFGAEYDAYTATAPRWVGPPRR
jgi:protein-S-isoprenylcysteine O-methyltransferase Ste14